GRWRTPRRSRLSPAPWSPGATGRRKGTIRCSTRMCPPLRGTEPTLPPGSTTPARSPARRAPRPPGPTGTGRAPAPGSPGRSGRRSTATSAPTAPP
ncbi:MAG: hypothetical protein AVDCRST_MAG88-3925, partial [uncultured Thermomicrobiales bacterium]